MASNLFSRCAQAIRDTGSLQLVMDFFQDTPCTAISDLDGDIITALRLYLTGAIE